MRQTIHTLLSLLLLLALVSCSQKPKRMPDTQPDVYGYITDIKYNTQNGKKAKAVVAVKALEGIPATYKDASVKIDEHTLLESDAGETLKLDQLREGHQIQAWFDGEVQAMQPAQGRAKAIRVSY